MAIDPNGSSVQMMAPSGGIMNSVGGKVGMGFLTGGPVGAGMALLGSKNQGLAQGVGAATSAMQRRMQAMNPQGADQGGGSYGKVFGGDGG